jgi:hypothetical protein
MLNQGAPNVGFIVWMSLFMSDPDSRTRKKKTRQSTQTQHDSVYLSMWTSKWLKLRWEQVGPMSDDI